MTSSPRAADVESFTAHSPAALVQAAQAGDREAFAKLYRDYAAMVHGILLSRVSPADAQDLTHEVFLIAMQRIGTLTRHERFGAWIAIIARNRAVDFHRGRRDETNLDAVHGIEDPRRSEAEEVLRVIGMLPEAYREPLILRLVEGMSGPEIAAQTGLTPESVRVNLHRGMKRLRQRLDEKKVVPR